MSDHDTQPLVELTAQEQEKTVSITAIEKAVQQLNEIHRHHFTYQLNNAHTALRGCSCGLTFVGLMAGDTRDLQWHQVREEGE